MPSFLWSLVNLVQAVFAAFWTSFWILAALGVRLIRRDPVPALAMARRFWAPGLLWIGRVRVRIDGLDRVDWTRSHYVVANHESIVDIVVLFRFLPVPLLFILKEELRKLPFVGRYAAAMGMIFLPRGNPRKSLKNLRQCRRKLDDGFSILMFPEGTRSRDGRIGRFKPGVFLPAIDGTTPLVPVVLEGTGRILPRGGFRARPGTVRVSIGSPVPTTGYTRDERHSLARDVRERMVAMRRDP